MSDPTGRASDGSAPASPPAGRSSLRLALRRIGLVAQALLCAGLVIWTAATGMVSFAVIAGTLLFVAVVLLVRGFGTGPLPGPRGDPRSPSPSAADLGEGAGDDDAEQPEQGQ